LVSAYLLSLQDNSNSNGHIYFKKKKKKKRKKDDNKAKDNMINTYLTLWLPVFGAKFLKRFQRKKEDRLRLQLIGDDLIELLPWS